MPHQTTAQGIATAVAALGLTASASTSFTPSNPTATSATSQKMMGLGSTCVFTPSGTGKVLVIAECVAATATGAAGVTIGWRYGTGSAPANGAAASGTAFAAAADPTIGPAAAAAAVIPYGRAAVVQLAPGNAYWFDAAVATANASDAASITAVCLTFIELTS